MQKNSKKYKQYTKTQSIEAIKIVCYYPRIIFFLLQLLLSQIPLYK